MEKSKSGNGDHASYATIPACFDSRSSVIQLPLRCKYCCHCFIWNMKPLIHRFDFLIHCSNAYCQFLSQSNSLVKRNDLCRCIGSQLMFFVKCFSFVHGVLSYCWTFCQHTCNCILCSSKVDSSIVGAGFPFLKPILADRELNQIKTLTVLVIIAELQD